MKIDRDRAFPNITHFEIFDPQVNFSSYWFFDIGSHFEALRAKKRGHLVFSTFFGIFSHRTHLNSPRALVFLGAIFLGSSSPKTRGTPRGLQGRRPHKKTWQTQKTYLEAPTPPSSL